MRYVKAIGWVLMAVAACAVIGLLVARWNIWFGNAPEPAYSTPNEPFHILLTLTDDENSRLITWQCDTVVQEACVEYFYRCDSAASHDVLQWVVATGEKYISPGGASVFYRAEIPTPRPGKYTYRICHPKVQSQWHDFVVNDMTDNVVRLAFIGDIQDSINGVTKDITRQIVMSHPDREFYVLGGDLIHRPQERYWDEFFRGISPLATTYPVVAVSGNHEYLKSLYKKCEARFPLHFAYYWDEYKQEDYCYKTLRYDNVELFMLDSHCDILRLIEQCRQLDEALSQSDAQWRVVVLHHPPLSIRSKSNNLPVKWLLTPILKRYDVELVLSGHEHGYARIHSTQDDSPVYIIGHCSPKVYKHRNTAVDVYDNSDKYYHCIDCVSDTMTLRTYTSRGELIDRIQWIKND